MPQRKPRNPLIIYPDRDLLRTTHPVTRYAVARQQTTVQKTIRRCGGYVTLEELR